MPYSKFNNHKIPPNPRPHQQHFVPKMHLDYFVGTDPKGHVWTYDITNETIRSSLPKNTAKQGNFYTVTDDSGKHHDNLENWFSGLESNAKKPYEKLLQGEIPVGKERQDFSTFLSSMYARSPVNLKNYGHLMGKFLQLENHFNISTFERFIKALHSSGQKDLSPQEEKEVYEYAKDPSKYIINIDHQATLQAVATSDYLQEIFFKMKWCVRESNRQHLITSDNPVVKVSDPKTHSPIYGGGGFMNRSAYITFPLSPKYCLMLGWILEQDITGHYVPLDKQNAMLLNKQRAVFCDKFLYANCQEQGIMKLGIKYKNSTPKIEIAGAMEKFADVFVKRNIKEKVT